MALNEITKGMSNAAEQINANFKNVVEKEDSGWLTSTVLLNGFTGIINYRKRGGLVNVSGTVKASGTGRITTPQTITKLPDEFKPVKQFRILGTASPVSTSFPEQHSAVLTYQVDGNIVANVVTAPSIDFDFNVTYLV